MKTRLPHSDGSDTNANFDTVNFPRSCATCVRNASCTFSASLGQDRSAELTARELSSFISVASRTVGVLSDGREDGMG